MLAGEGLPLVAPARAEDLLDLPVRLAPRALELLVEQVLAADAVAPVAPELRLQRAERHPAVGALVGAVADQRAGQLGVAALRGDAVAEPAGRDHGEPAQRAVGHRDVDELALARAVALAQRREDAEGGHQRAAADVGDLPRRLHRRAAAVAGQPEQADQAEVVHVVPAAVAVRAVLAVAGDRAVDQPRVDLPQAVVADAQAVQDARPERLEEDVGVAGEAQQHVAALVGLEIDPDRALAPVERQEERRVGALLGALVVRRRPAHVVAHAGVLDLDHVGAEVAEQQRAEPAGQQPREVEDAQPLERTHAAALAGSASSLRASSTVAGRRPTSSVI